MKAGKLIKVNLGAGYVQHPDYINCDINPLCEPDMLFDATEGLPFEDNSLDEVRTIDFLEHIPMGKVVPLITEIHRVLKPTGHFVSMTPSTESCAAFQAPDHVSYWNKMSWLYYMNENYMIQCGIKVRFSGIVVDVIPAEHFHSIYVLADLQPIKPSPEMSLKMQKSDQIFLDFDRVLEQIRKEANEKVCEKHSDS